MTAQAFDATAMMKLFDPEQMTKMFDLEKMKAAFALPEIPGVDLNNALESNQKNFEAMRIANTAATEAYRDFYQKQMAIFEDSMKTAKKRSESLESLSGADSAQKSTEIYRAAMEQALENMTALAVATKKANEEAFATIQERVKNSLDELKHL